MRITCFQTPCPLGKYGQVILIGATAALLGNLNGWCEFFVQLCLPFFSQAITVSSNIDDR